MLAAALAGCLAAPPPAPPGEPAGVALPVPRDWALRALPFGEGHDHASVEDHEGLSTPNFEVVGYDPLFSESYGGTTPGGYLCGDAQPTLDGRRLAVVESRSDVGFAIADVTDPAQPRWLGELVMRGTRVYDLALVPDGRHVVLVTANLEPEQLRPRAAPEPHALAPQGAGDGNLGGPALAWRSACDPGTELTLRAQGGEDPILRPASILLVSIEDPREPVIVDHRPLAGFGHSAFATVIDGRRLVLASTWAQTSLTSNFQFYEVLDTPLGARLSHLATWVPPPPAGQDPRTYPVLLGHDDGWIAKHPLTGQTLAWLADWDLGIWVLDLAEPLRPRLVGHWTDWAPGREGYTGGLHSVYPLPEAWGERHYTVVGPEWGGHPVDHPTGIVRVLDTTDPSKPREAAAWTLPHDVEWAGSLMFSTHYLSVVGRTAFVSMYHGGIWALDLGRVGEEGFVLLPSVGVFLPTRVSPKPPAEPVRWTPTVEEALAMPDGSIVTFDSNSGLYVLRFDASRPAPAPEPWPVEPVTLR